MFIPRGAVHWFYNPFDEPVEMIFIYMSYVGKGFTLGKK